MTLEEFTARQETHGEFDIAILNHVLEHFVNPLRQLRLARDLLHEDGFLFAEVPNILGAWNGIGMFHIAHLYQFHKATFRNLLRASGLRLFREDLQGNAIHPWAMTFLSGKSISEPIVLPSASEIRCWRKEILCRLGKHGASPLTLRKVRRWLKSRFNTFTRHRCTL